MRSFVRIAVPAVLLAGAISAHAAREWRAERRLTADDLQTVEARLAGLPLHVGEPAYHGTRSHVAQDIVTLSGADRYAAIDYRGEDGASVRLHVGIAARTDAWLHEPTVCLPAHGWVPVESGLVPLWPGLSHADDAARVHRLLVRRPDQQLLTYYWFQYGENVITSRFERARLRLQDLLSGRRDRPLQIVIMYTSVGRDLAASEARLESLVQALWPDLFFLLAAGGE